VMTQSELPEYETVLGEGEMPPSLTPLREAVGLLIAGAIGGGLLGALAMGMAMRWLHLAGC
jgi:hypothetical protein